MQGSVVTLCSDECVHLWEISNRDGVSCLQHVRSLSLENKYDLLFVLRRLNSVNVLKLLPNCILIIL